MVRGRVWVAMAMAAVFGATAAEADELGTEIDLTAFGKDVIVER